MSEIEMSAVDATWEEVSSLKVSRIPAEMERAGRDQPELMAFVLGSTEGMSRGVGELAGFIYFVIWRSFRPNMRGKVKTITGRAIQRQLEDNEQSLIELDGVDPQSVDSISLARLTRQPALLRYVIESIAEAEEDENEPVSMSPEEKGSLILLLKTAIDLLDTASQSQ